MQATRTLVTLSSVWSKKSLHSGSWRGSFLHCLATSRSTPRASRANTRCSQYRWSGGSSATVTDFSGGLVAK